MKSTPRNDRDRITSTVTNLQQNEFPQINLAHCLKTTLQAKHRADIHRRMKYQRNLIICRTRTTINFANQ